MTTPSNAAKAAALMHCTSGVEDYDQALAIYTALANDDGPVYAMLDKFPGVAMWDKLDALDDGDWWSEVTQLAQNIDDARKHFGE